MWVPKVLKKKKWWKWLKKSKNSNPEKNEMTGSEKEMEGEINKNKLIENGKSGNDEKLDENKNKKEKNKDNSKKENNFDRKYDTSTAYVLNDNGLINQFVHTMYVLLESGSRVSIDKIISTPLQAHVSHTSQKNDEKQRKKVGAEKRLEFLLYDKNKKQKNVGVIIDTIKKLLLRARVTREKLRVVKLMNAVSGSGHTALSWAAASGKYGLYVLIVCSI